MKGVVLGGTGAIGQELVKQLVGHPAFDTVVTIGRRVVELPKDVEDKAGKLQQHVINMDNMKQEAGPFFAGADVVFCTLGTTRKAAGSAEAFKKVDYEYVSATAEVAKQAGVKHFSLVSAAGANAKLWANDLAPFHGLLYARTKGLAEQAVIDKAFPAVSIFRPGMLDRGPLMRPLERMFMPLFKPHKMPDVARTLIQDALRTAEALKGDAGATAGAGAGSSTGGVGVRIYEAAAMHKSATTGQPPEL